MNKEQEQNMSELMLKKLAHRRLTRGRIIKRGIFFFIGAILMAIGIEVFLVPNGIMDGGIVGISIILSQITGVQLGLFLFLLNVPFFFIGYKQIGKTFAISTVFAITVLSISTYFLHTVPAFTAGGFVFSWEKAMYSILAYFIAFKTIDIVIEGLNESKSAWIISDHHKDIGDALLARLGRGVTYLQGEGAYTGDDKKVIFTVITRLEEAKLKSIVEELDESAFLAVANIAEVRGGRFKKRDIH